MRKDVTKDKKKKKKKRQSHISDNESIADDTAMHCEDDLTVLKLEFILVNNLDSSS